MRKALIAVITAAVLFAVGAFAAELAVSSDDVASGQAAVEACGGAEVTWTTNTSGAVNTNGDWSVDGATVTFDNTDCNGAAVDLALGLDTDTVPDGNRNSWQDWTCTDVASLTSTCSPPTTTGPPVVQVVEVSVLANGNSINATVGG